ncbi:Pyrazinamidase nicotinamidase [Lecanosticta acicola]|uniref:nicotinamidase n=1 Tax=Lecanosticta acicola TaxID=111012 RepID=A0AAI8Z8J4_9PEZI|nr:Pyrazinamidase nicotinamidase [Lecanosticta acicola]
MASIAIPKAGLMVVDMQEDFCEPSGALAVKGGRELAPIINELLARPGFVVKVASRDFHPRGHISFASSHAGAEAFKSSHTIKNPENEAETQTTLLWPDHCVQGTSGCELIPELHANKLTYVVDKGTDNRAESYSAFGPPFRNPKYGTTGLEKYLRDAGVTHLFVVGLAFDFCVRSTALDAAELGFNTFVIQEATNSVMRWEEARASTGKEFAEKGVKLITLDSEELKMVN